MSLLLELEFKAKFHILDMVSVFMKALGLCDVMLQPYKANVCWLLSIRPLGVSHQRNPLVKDPGPSRARVASIQQK